MFCGAGSFPREDDDPVPSSPSPLKRITSRRKGSSKNPYSARGLDKFSAVLADLENRKQRIMAQACAQGKYDCMVRFMYTSSRDWAPIVIKLRDPIRQSEIVKEEEEKKTKKKKKQPKSPTLAPQLLQKLETPKAKKEDAVTAEPVALRKAVMRRGSLKGKRGGGGCYWWVLVLVVILLFLALFGRTFAICCTSMLWYLVPAVRGHGRDESWCMKKREIKAEAPTKKKLGGLEGFASPRQHQIGAT